MLDYSIIILSDLLNQEEDKTKIMKLTFILGNLRVVSDRLNFLLENVDDLFFEGSDSDYDYDDFEEDFNKE